MMPPMAEDLKAIVPEMMRRTWSLAAIGVAAERGVLSALAERPRTVDELAGLGKLAPATTRALVEVLAALGLVEIDGDQVRGLAALPDARAAAVLAADIRSTLGTTRDAAYRAAEDGAIEGWRAIDPVAVRAQGLVSHAVTLGLAQLLRATGDLHARLSAEGARFLDVGAGAGGVVIAFATMYPTLRLVGLEPSALACAEALRVVEAAGVASRAEIRNVFGQDLDEEAVYAAAYVAQMFIPDDAVDAVWRATARALVPGGWLLTGTIAIDGAELAPSLARLRSAVWGGGVRRAPEVMAALERAGFVEVRTLPGPMPAILARRLGA